MEIYIRNLILEVTRRCNFNCEHCLRGHAQNMDMQLPTFKYAAQNFIVDTITFTGGEPAFNLKGMKKYIDYTIQYNHLPTSFWMATNGTVQPIELATWLLKLYTLMDCKEVCGVAVSKDYFHEACTSIIDKHNMEVFKALTFYDNSKEHDVKYDDSWVKSKGNAQENGIGRNFSWIQHERGDNELYVEFYEGNITIEELYVSANGFCVACCDLPYEEVDTRHLCHISKFKSYLKQTYRKELKDSLIVTA